MKKAWNYIWAANPLVVDGGIGALVTLTSLSVSVATAETARRPLDLPGIVLTLVAGGALAYRRRAPMPMLGVSSIAYYAYFLRDYSFGLEIAFLISVWSAAMHDERPRIGIIANSALPLVLLAWVLGTDDASGRIGGSVRGGRVVFTVVITALVSYSIRLRREKGSHERRSEEAEAGRAVSDERLRIARELHDIVAHAMSVVAVQAGVAAHVIDQQPEEARRMLENVRTTSQEALDEMRRLLGVLRGGDATLAPAPGLADLGSLVESLREAGVAVDLTVAGDPEGVPSGVDLTAYRIVQEALTNVVRHAGAGATSVTVEYATGVVRVEVVDDGREVPTTVQGGHGILGMRERVAVFGGDLEVGPKPGGGFRVQATVPYSAA